MHRLHLYDRYTKTLQIFDQETRHTHSLETRSRLKYDKQNRTVNQHSEEESNQHLAKSTEQFWLIINKSKTKLQDSLKPYEKDLYLRGN